jgi:WD40-like Beta Propeller Repeat
LLTVLVIGAVIVIGGFAAADAIRGNPRPERQAIPTVPAQTTPTRLPGPAPRPEAPPNWPEGLLDGVLTLADAETCDIRQIGLPGGRERPLAQYRGCQLWAPPVGPRVAYALGASSADGLQPFRIADLANPRLELGGYRALFGVVVWSPDGQRIAWCGRRRTGFDLEIGGPSTRLPRCPASYTRDNQIAYAVGNQVLVGDRPVFTADGGITYAKFGLDGSLAVVVDGKRIERWDGSALTTTTNLPRAYQGITPILRADNCAALLPLGGAVQLLDLGCKPGLPNRSFPGNAAAWSPDGTWIVTSNGVELEFQRVVGSRLDLTWPVGASALAWRPD